MNSFEKQIAGTTGDGLYSLHLQTLQVNLGLRCNQQCMHCHLVASPYRTEIMEWPIMQLVLEAARGVGCRLMDLTGGAPELNPHFCRFVEALHKDGHCVQVRTNLTVLLEPDMQTIPEFFRKHEVQLVVFLFPNERPEKVVICRLALRLIYQQKTWLSLRLVRG